MKAEERNYLSQRKAWIVPFLVILSLYLVYRAISIERYVSFQLLILIGLGYTLTVSFTIFGRFVFAFNYHPSDFTSISYEPMVTVVIPAKNEEAAITETVTSVLDSDYPKEKLDVLVINDGSTDGTQAQLEKLMLKEPRLAVERFEQNRGKRPALEFGFKNAKGDVVVVLDSDTAVRPNCIKEIVKPLADPKIGGVSGHTDVKNPKNYLEKMQDANYFALYHLFKRAEASLHIVTCLPGCASAYRKSAVLPFIDAWSHQKFLGTPCTVGEDRGLTTFLLRSGWNTVYTPAALTETTVPSKMKNLLTQRLRWKRSFFREAVLQSQFMHERWGAIYFYPYIVTSVVAPFLAVVLLFIAPLIVGPIMVGFYVGGIILVSFVYSVYSKMYRRSFSSLWLAAWSVFNLLILTFVSLYAIATITDGRWGTR